MKKLLLTFFTVALFVVVSMAQQQQDTTLSDQYRRDRNEQLSEQRKDSTMSNTGEDSVQYRTEEEMQPSGQEDRDAQQGNNEEMQPENEQQGQGIQQRTDVGDESSASDPAMQQVDQPTGREDQDTTAVSGSTTEKTRAESGSETQPGMTHNVEVVEDKEGPQGQVVYKMNNEYFYIDQDRERKIVKVDESQLRDSKHKVIVKSGTSGSYSKSGKRKSNKG